MGNGRTEAIEVERHVDRVAFQAVPDFGDDVGNAAPARICHRHDVVLVGTG